MPLITVTKCQGTGNDFVLLDARAMPDAPYSPMAKQLCERRFSLGADGLLVISEAKRAGCDVAMRIFNADGSEAEMCGNGIRCVTRFLYEENTRNTPFDIETPAGIIQTDVVTWQGEPGVRVSMGVPTFSQKILTQLQPSSHVNEVARLQSRAQISPDVTLLVGDERVDAYAVSMGNPHTVVFVLGDPASVEFEAVAAAVDGRDDLTGSNVEIATVVSGGIRMRVRERGVGETWGCGTGACAVAAIAILSGRATAPVLVHSRGGSVGVEWAGMGQPAFLTGDAHLVYRTEVEVPQATSPAPR